jgi:hypothetical protein
MTNFIETISKRRAVVAGDPPRFSSRAFVDTLHHALANRQARKALDAATAKGWAVVDMMWDTLFYGPDKAVNGPRSAARRTD